MGVQEYDAVFVGGGLAAMLLLRAARGKMPGRVAVIDPTPLLESSAVHWSYWSRDPSFYDRFAIGSWRWAEAAGTAPQSIAPFTLRLARSSDVYAHVAELLEGAPIDWLRATARSISRRSDDTYEVVTDTGAVRASWVFDSACDVAPVFPAPERPRAVLSGTGIRVTSDRPVFDAATATLCDPLDERSFAYSLPLSSVEALIESASFGPVEQEGDPAPLLDYLRARYPRASFDLTHVEHGSIPLGFAPARTSGPRHVLLGTKRGLVKPSAGYGVVRIAEESERLARLWEQRRPPAPSRRSSWRWWLLDAGFLQLAARDSRLPLALLRDVMQAAPLSRSLRFIDEELPLRQLVPLFPPALSVLLRAPRLLRDGA